MTPLEKAIVALQAECSLLGFDLLGVQVTQLPRARDALVRTVVQDQAGEFTIACPRGPVGVMGPVDAEVEALRAERDKAREDVQFMVERAANERLDGYRELGRRAADAENARDDALRALNEANESRDLHVGLYAEVEALLREARAELATSLTSDLGTRIDAALAGRT